MPLLAQVLSAGVRPPRLPHPPHPALIPRTVRRWPRWRCCWSSCSCAWTTTQRGSRYIRDCCRPGWPAGAKTPQQQKFRVQVYVDFRVSDPIVAHDDGRLTATITAMYYTFSTSVCTAHAVLQCVLHLQYFSVSSTPAVLQCTCMLHGCMFFGYLHLLPAGHTIMSPSLNPPGYNIARCYCHCHCHCYCYCYCYFLPHK